MFNAYLFLFFYFIFGRIVQSVGRSSKLLLVFASTVILVPSPAGLMTISLTRLWESFLKRKLHQYIVH
jgi:hypothetical protein